MLTLKLVTVVPSTVLVEYVAVPVPLPLESVNCVLSTVCDASDVRCVIAD